MYYLSIGAVLIYDIKPKKVIIKLTNMVHFSTLISMPFLDFKNSIYVLHCSQEIYFKLILYQSTDFLEVTLDPL